MTPTEGDRSPLPSADYFSDKVTERLPGRVDDDSRAEPTRLPARPHELALLVCSFIQIGWCGAHISKTFFREVTSALFLLSSSSSFLVWTDTGRSVEFSPTHSVIVLSSH